MNRARRLLLPCSPRQPPATTVSVGSTAKPADNTDTRSGPTPGAWSQAYTAYWPALASLLASGELGQHNGLPASIIVTTTLRELEAAAGRGLTGGGTLLPMSDVIRLASHAHHYLCIFDKGKALALYHTKRLASPAQRIVLYAKDRGCTAPGCDVPGYFTEVHHVTPGRKPTPPTSTIWRSAAAATTRSPNKAGPPAKTSTATPNGSPHRTSTTANLAPTPSTTPRNCCATTKTTTNRKDV